ncbi:hypothetical protein KA050_04160 [Candidatus Gracilibacteria bacterium]|nr:hypothetical protein [Candidatus Gracilibacteria bacterium]
MKRRENLGHKAPKGSGFPGLVPEEAVWDNSVGVASQQANTQTAIENALGIGLDHTVKTLIGMLARPEQIKEAAISSNLRTEVVEAINAARIAEKIKQSLLGVLDTVPRLSSNQKVKDIPFDGKLETFITERERQAILALIQEEEGCRSIEAIKLINPRSRGGVRILGYRIGSSGNARIELHSPVAGRLSIKFNGKTKIVPI